MSNNIKIVRKNLELTQEQVSLLTGVPVKTLRNWEQEVRKPSDWTIDLVMDRLLRVKMEEYAKIDEYTGVLSFLTIKENISKIAKNYDIEKVYLFGSYVKGQATQNSDVDLYIESDLYGLEYFEFVEQLRENLKKKVEVLSNITVQEYSKIDEEIKKSGALIYER